MAPLFITQDSLPVPLSSVLASFYRCQLEVCSGDRIASYCISDFSKSVSPWYSTNSIKDQHILVGCQSSDWLDILVSTFHYIRWAARLYEDLT